MQPMSAKTTDLLWICFGAGKSKGLTVETISAEECLAAMEQL